MDARRRRQARRRPVVLFAALLAPAILAVGLLAGEAGRSEQVDERRGGVTAERPVGFGPVAVGAPARPVRAFAAPVPARRVAKPEPVVRAAVATPKRSRKREVEPPDPVVREVRRVEVCPGEWEDTWLWELCREHERRVMAEARRGG